MRHQSILIGLAGLLLGLPAALAQAPGDSGREQLGMEPGQTSPLQLEHDTTEPLPLDSEPSATRPAERPGMDLQLPEGWNVASPEDIGEPLQLSVENAVFLALQNNRDLAVQQLEPLIAGTFEAVERARFDPTLFGELSLQRDSVIRQSPDIQQEFAVRSQSEVGEVGIRQELPTGTSLELSISSDRSDSSRTLEQFGSRAGVSLTQALLQGASIESNLAQLRQAELDTLASVYQVRGFAEALVEDVELTYWDFVLAQRQLEIFREALAVAEQQLEETRRRIEVGDRPETEETSARAEVALRRQGVIEARNDRERARITLLQLINPPGAGWASPVETEDAPDGQADEPDPVTDHVTLGQRLRPDLNEARLQVQRGELEVVRTRSGLLPRLDLFVTLGKTGFARSFGESWRDMDDSGFDLAAGLSFELPLGNRAARAESRRAGLDRQQAMEAVGNLAQLAALDVQLAWLEAERSREQINATAVTRQLQEEVLRAEQARFSVGAGTALAVSQAQRDLLESQLDEVEAAIRYRQALTTLHRQSGTLLVRRGIEAPGAEEVVLR